MTKKGSLSTASVFLYVMYSAAIMQLVACLLIEQHIIGRILFGTQAIMVLLFFILYEQTNVIQIKLSLVIVIAPITRFFYLILLSYFNEGSLIVLSRDIPFVVLTVSALLIVMLNENSKWKNAVLKGGRYIYFMILALFFILAATFPISWLEQVIPYIITAQSWETEVSQFKERFKSLEQIDMTMAEVVKNSIDGMNKEQLIYHVDDIFMTVSEIRKIVGKEVTRISAEQFIYTVYQDAEAQFDQRSDTALARISSINNLTVQNLMNDWFYPFYSDKERDILLHGSAEKSTKAILDLLREQNSKIELELKGERIRYEDEVARVDFFTENALQTLSRLEKVHQQKVSAIIAELKNSDSLMSSSIAEQVAVMHKVLMYDAVLEEVAQTIAWEYGDINQLLMNNDGPVFISQSGNRNIEENPYKTALIAFFGIIVLITGLLMLFNLHNIRQWKLLYMVPLAALIWLWLFISWIPVIIPSLTIITVAIIMAIISSNWDYKITHQITNGVIKITSYGWNILNMWLDTSGASHSKRGAEVVLIVPALITFLLWILSGFWNINWFEGWVSRDWVVLLLKNIREPVNLIVILIVCSLIMSLFAKLFNLKHTMKVE